MKSRPVKNFFRKHKTCEWSYVGRGMKANEDGYPIEVLGFTDNDCGISETMPIHAATNTIPIGNKLLADMGWRVDRFKFGSIEFLRAAKKDQIAPDKAVFFYPTMFHTYDGEFGQCEFNVNGNLLGEGEDE